MSAVVTGLWTYPVKSCAGVVLAEAELTWAGLAHDRTFMVTGPDGVFRSQRRDPRLAGITPRISADGTQLSLQAPGAGVLDVEVDLTTGGRPVELFGDPYRGIDQGETVARWLTGVLGQPSRLVRVPPDHDRVAAGWTPGPSGYADGNAVHLISQASLAGLNGRIDGPAVPMSRFRPNIVIDGWDDPHREDQARRVTIGDSELGFAEVAIRCAVTLVDQGDGTRAGPEPIRTLASYRRAAAGGVAFGSKFSVLRLGKLAVGDGLTVTEWGPPEPGP
ncbi:MAG TPA: MOSC N-terminal beta barrel domain-containing protein [Streptosporangiaceae bacterium]